LTPFPRTSIPICLQKRPIEAESSAEPVKIIFGVKAIGSSGEEGRAVMGRLLIILSISDTNVNKSNSSKVALFVIVLNNFLQCERIPRRNRYDENQEVGYTSIVSRTSARNRTSPYCSALPWCL